MLIDQRVSSTIFMRILQPQTESGPRNYFFIFFSFCFSFFFLFHIILRSCEIVIFIFFIPQLCGNVILICLSCFPHVQLILIVTISGVLNHDLFADEQWQLLPLCLRHIRALQLLSGEQQITMLRASYIYIYIFILYICMIVCVYIHIYIQCINIYIYIWDILYTSSPI